MSKLHDNIQLSICGAKITETEPVINPIPFWHVSKILTYIATITNKTAKPIWNNLTTDNQYIVQTHYTLHYTGPISLPYWLEPV